MSPSHQACFVMEVFDFNVEDHVAFEKLYGTFLPSSRALNATCTFFIYFTMASAHRVDTVHLSITTVPFTNFGREWLYLWIFLST